MSVSTNMATKNLDQVSTFEEDGKCFARIPKKNIKTNGQFDTGRLTATDPSNFEDIVEKLEKYGMCMIKNHYSVQDCEQIKKEILPHYYREESWNGSPFPKQTTVAPRCALKSKTCRDKIVCDDLYSKLCHQFLSESNLFWIGEGLRRGQSGFHLASGIAYRVGPGACDQMYHREDMVHHNVHPARDRYHYGDDSHLGMAVALTKMNKVNGATRAIVGSHLWGPLDGPGDFDKNMEIHLEMEEGDVIIMLGSVYHAASANSSDSERIAGFFFMNKSYLKQEENYHIDQSPEFFKDMSLQAMALLGLHISEPFCGHINYKSPAFHINPALENSGGVRKEKYSQVLFPKFETSAD
ncbi:LAME_0H06832g1_1 [Lachancea meyersii CBS 8951]|uniref:LAME_0H06832g1_1 n=1 Tax=Lachancea meyersii CBS 8951 TaxID=1266667 RepID=A0A1G4KEU1_9SACH|nr:LAME_0H06832g1_1 [Lachancea meyersii CBS 8951]